ncbi:membrane protein [Mycolicibacterium aurum]|uniref:Membrane protein n=1 Tax=Mycolicibacterium aurum TaxID=1791 RepID=A0A3S4RSR1_MYCAU|nr:membrane protein [Mycolicibacterium aurum]VEG51464.1 membrane protein [Mycolicibacterium aurum]
MSKENSRAASIGGLALAATGVSHFVAPQVYEGITKAAFPTNTRQHVYIDGAVETAVGLGLAVQRTRKIAVVGLVVYLLYMMGNVVRNR